MSMLLVGAIISALVLLALVIVVLLRALAYLNRHPELRKTRVPVTYVYCQRLLKAIIDHYQKLDITGLDDRRLNWQSPGGYRYAVHTDGIDQQRGSNRYSLRWNDIGGVGVRMQPGFRFVDRNRDGDVDGHYTTGYTFFVLVVPHSGRTMSIQIPTDGNTAVIEFVATVLAFADRQKKRINVFGFDKPPAPRHQRVARY